MDERVVLCPICDTELVHSDSNKYLYCPKCKKLVDNSFYENAQPAKAEPVNAQQDEVIRSRDGKIEVTDVATDTDVENNDIVLDEVHKTVAIKSLTEEIMEKLGTVHEQYGIEIMTVEVKKLDLPDDNKQAVYTRMISERENIAAQYTAEGESQARIIRNTTDKEVSIMLSEANAKAEQIKAEGEAEYMKILSGAYNDESKSDFYSFVRSLDAAKTSMKGKGQKTLILPADSPIAEVFAGY